MEGTIPTAPLLCSITWKIIFLYVKFFCSFYVFPAALLSSLVASENNCKTAELKKVALFVEPIIQVRNKHKMSMFASKNKNKKFRARRTSEDDEEKTDNNQNKPQDEDVNMQEVETKEETPQIKPASSAPSDLPKKAPQKDTKKSLLTFGDEVIIHKYSTRNYTSLAIILNFFAIYD